MFDRGRGPLSRPISLSFEFPVSFLYFGTFRVRVRAGRVGRREWRQFPQWSHRMEGQELWRARGSAHYRESVTFVLSEPHDNTQGEREKHRHDRQCHTPAKVSRDPRG